MAAYEPINGPIIPNPGNGLYAVRTLTRGGIKSITIFQADPAVPLSGSLVFTLGENAAEIDLAAGQRFLGLGSPVDVLYMEASGVNINQAFSIRIS